MRSVTVRDLDPAADADWARAAVEEAFGSPLQARRGELIDTSGLPGLVAEVDGEPVALALYDARPELSEVELAVLATPVRGAGGGTAVVEALRKRAGGRPVWAVTTNDNVDALRFYQRFGFRLRELRAGAIDDARRTLKPEIPAVGRHGIRIRDEIELVLDP